MTPYGANASADRMPRDGFNSYLEAVIQLLCTEVAPGTDPKHLVRHVEGMTGIRRAELMAQQGGGMTGPLLTIDEAAARLRKPSGRWLWDWLRQHAQPVDEPPYFYRPVGTGVQPARP